MESSRPREAVDPTEELNCDWTLHTVVVWTKHKASVHIEGKLYQTPDMRPFLAKSICMHRLGEVRFKSLERQARL